MLIQKVLGWLPNSLKVSRMFSQATWSVAMNRLADGEEHRLVGPPELYRPKPTAKDKGGKEPPMGWTENCSPTYLSSGIHCLDLFFHVVPDTPAGQVTKRLKLAWDEDPYTALKLVFNLRGVRGTGKLDREGFYSCALWLHENHPKTLAGNVGSIAEFGYFKDLLEILYRVLEGPTARKTEKQLLLTRQSIYGENWWVKPTDKTSLKEWYRTVKVISRAQKRLAAAKIGIERYKNDPVYRSLHEQISNVFAEHLRSDLEKINSGKYNNLSLAAKWCPSLYSTFDNYTMLCESIGRKLFPRDQYPEYDGIEDAHYAYRVRDRLRKEVLVPLRKAQKLPEIYMSAREWGSVVYTRVASVAMKNYKDLFRKYDGERFRQYLDSVKKGKKKIAAGALLPHEIVRSVKYQEDEVAELQWKKIVEDLSEIGKLKNCLAICDVSGSMCGEPLDVSVALGMLVSELSEEPWKGKLITFSSNPQMQVISGNDLRSKIHFFEQMDWGMTTNFQKVFDKILQAAVVHKLTEDQMIKRLFVFSDMEFDQASENKWETDYRAIVRKFNEKGFTRVPEIVFWNLRNSSATPVPSHQRGVALVSGFSKNLLKVFLEDGGILDPVKTMEAAIAGQEYQKLVVLD